MTQYHGACLTYIKTSGSPEAVLSSGRVATECANVPDSGYVDGVIAEEAVESPW